LSLLKEGVRVTNAHDKANFCRFLGKACDALGDRPRAEFYVALGKHLIVRAQTPLLSGT
jgi:hypothetical protein